MSDHIAASVISDIPLDLPDIRQKLEELIARELPRLQHLQSPVLHIEGIFRDADTERLVKSRNNNVLSTVDLSPWRSRESAPNNDQQALAEEVTAASPGDPGRCDQPCERRLNLGKRQRKRRRTGDPDSCQGPKSGTVKKNKAIITPPPSSQHPSQRQLHSSADAVPQRRRLDLGAEPHFRPSSLDKLIRGIWEQIHSGIEVTLPAAVSETVRAWPTACISQAGSGLPSVDFGAITKTCHLVSCAGRSFRALEIVVQALWIECFNARVTTLAAEAPTDGLASIHKAALMEACQEFNWSEKQLRNKIAIWKGYHEIKEAAGWSALVFAGAGIYRYCKYRVGFDSNALARLSRHRARFEVAADTIQPQWRGLLSLLLGTSRRTYRGHPHDWAVGKYCDPVPLAWTYRQWDQNFTYEHITASILDQDAWADVDPRRISTFEAHVCSVCKSPQSNDMNRNRCQCFPDLFGPVKARLPPVQVFQTKDGRNNGLLACCTFDRGAVIGEFVGLITKGLENMDVMCGRVGTTSEYQIWQGRQGNHTRFINHSCLPNAQFETFPWLGIEHVIIVSKGIAADSEITVDYSGRYWSGLDKQCLCGQSSCRYANKNRNSVEGQSGTSSSWKRNVDQTRLGSL